MADFNAVRAAIFAELTKFEGVGALDPSREDDVSFDDLENFTSLKAVELCMAMEEQFGIEVDMAEITEVDSVDAFAQRILALTGKGENGAKADRDAGPATGEERLVEFNKGNVDVTPVFFVHGGGGAVMAYKEMASFLPDEVPTYGIQMRMPGYHAGPFASISEMATAYCSLVEPILKGRRFKMAGYSGGGLIAHEMATLLGEKERSRLLMIDSVNPALDQSANSLAKRLTMPIFWSPTNLARVRLKKRLRETREERLARYNNHDEAAFQKTILDAFASARENYKPKMANADIMVVRAKASAWEVFRAGPAMGWEKHVMGATSSIAVDATHFTLFQEETLKTWLPRGLAFLAA